jgi:hypothetical protein
MKRLMWGSFLFLVLLASAPWQIVACDQKKSLIPTYMEASSMVTRVGDKTVVISSDEDFVTVTVYENPSSDWI